VFPCLFSVDPGRLKPNGELTQIDPKTSLRSRVLIQAPVMEPDSSSGPLELDTEMDLSGIADLAGVGLLMAVIWFIGVAWIKAADFVDMRRATIQRRGGRSASFMNR
jgi:hypothetical protein